MKIEYYVEFGDRSSHTGREVAWYRAFMYAAFGRPINQSIDPGFLQWPE